MQPDLKAKESTFGRELTAADFKLVRLGENRTDRLVAIAIDSDLRCYLSRYTPKRAWLTLNVCQALGQ